MNTRRKRDRFGPSGAALFLWTIGRRAGWIVSLPLIFLLALGSVSVYLPWWGPAPSVGSVGYRHSRHCAPNRDEDTKTEAQECSHWSLLFCRLGVVFDHEGPLARIIKTKIIHSHLPLLGNLTHRTSIRLMTLDGSISISTIIAIDMTNVVRII